MQDFGPDREGEYLHKADLYPEFSGVMTGVMTVFCYMYVDRLGEFCGNGLREGMEQCDAGFNNNADTCCDTSCRYRSSAFVCRLVVLFY